jgi:hypothetical protein
VRVFKNAWFARFARKEEIADQALWDAVVRAEQGQIDADLGGGVIKQRLARAGAGKSGGYRSIVLYRQGHKAFFVFGFAKNELDNISKDEVRDFKRMAKYVLALSDIQLQSLVENRQFEEMVNDGKKVSE